MFPDYHMINALVVERHDRLRSRALRRRFLRSARPDGTLPNRPEPSTTRLAAFPTAARSVVSSGRTPGETHRAA
ncbi:MAG TPA: hypothetical protein VFG94_10755 [Acidimicrobiales bacterium]|nr:hypothetical protein [Acidimicrobiales bacterium]